ncbi:MAG TPA: chemotaxis protein CheA [Acidobacteriaceae bacterium]|jgi:two-component system chemotaxis sensor kinase CheA|nr:chemotaxis protein CheA [Acidobacteriaceae bacterium]
MKIDLTQFRETFLLESAEHIAAIESGLLELRSRPGDAELLNAIFRSAHSIKGGAGSFGLENLAHFTHKLESLLDRMRAMEIGVSEEIIALLLESTDVLRALLDSDADSAMLETARRLALRITAYSGIESAEPADEPAVAEEEHEAAGGSDGLSLYRIEFRPDRELFSSGTNPIVLLRNLAALGDVSVTHLNAEELPPLSELDPEQCYLSWTLEVASSRGEEDLHAVFEFVEHLAEVSIRRLDADPAESAASAPPHRTGAAAPDQGVRSPARAAAHPRQDRESRTARSSSGGESSSIRVATEKVDRLIDLVGELVIAHVMTAQMVEGFTPDCLPKLRESVAAMERNTRELHERVMGIRMLPVGTLFQRYARTVYDIAQATGKQIELELSGEETEIDKSMLELLGDPLTHLVRNAADHGIETPEQRVAAGKPAQGAISLRAFHRSGRVVIEVADDGAGIDPRRVRAKAIERGLIPATAQMDDDQLRMLIFEPGFSTRDEVSDLSGRGVGMDVVRQNVQQLNGTVTLSSEIGRGSTVLIELPLTLAILEGLLVRVADRTLVLPLLTVVETVSPRSGQIQRVAEQGEVVVIREETIPLLRLRRFLRLASAADDGALRSLVVVVEAGRKKIGLVIDELLGQQQVVVKSLERHLRKVDGLMGATILGDGCVAPIVDVACLAGMNLFGLEAMARGESVTPISQNSPGSGERGETTHAMV